MFNVRCSMLDVHFELRLPRNTTGSLMDLLGRLLKIDKLDSIERMDVSLAAPWAQSFAAWMVPVFLLLSAGALYFYLRCQSRARPGLRVLLALDRALVLCLLFLFLADPILILRLSHAPRPWFWVLFDGSDSMAIEDDLTDAERQRIDAATGRAATPSAPAADSPPDESVTAEPLRKPSRQDYVAAMLRKRDGNVLRQLSEK